MRIGADPESEEGSGDEAVYGGDISTWGHKKVSGFYSKNPTSESDYTMSSGLSPRDTRPRPREFNVEAAKKVMHCNGPQAVGTSIILHIPPTHH